jgi:hypothetical protein
VTPSPISLGAVGYLSQPSGAFVALFNAFNPADGVVHSMPSVKGYGEVQTGLQKMEFGCPFRAVDVQDVRSCVFLHIPLSSFGMMVYPSVPTYTHTSVFDRQKREQEILVPLACGQSCGVPVYRYFVKLRLRRSGLKQM